MKKIIAAALALTMTLGMSTTALAAGNVDGAGVGSQNPIDVTAKYNDDATESTVYSVDLTWEDMTFTYNDPAPEPGIRTPTPIRTAPLPVGIRPLPRLRPPTTPTPRVTVKFDYTRRALPA